jgi:hypothetical protein
MGEVERRSGNHGPCAGLDQPGEPLGATLGKGARVRAGACSGPPFGAR